MQYLIALAVALLFGRSYLAVAPKLWCVGHQRGVKLVSVPSVGAVV